MPRPDGRAPDQLRPVSFVPNVAPHASGSVLVNFGNTRVICAATIQEDVPRWMKSQAVPGGWLTAEYSMLPYSTHDRKSRDISRGKLDGRSSEIQRLIGRALRAVTDLKKLGARTVWVDCDVLQADGGTRTASITGGFVALILALRQMQAEGRFKTFPVSRFLASISVGIFEGRPLLDLKYDEDVKAEVDMNVVMLDNGDYVEVQGTAEGQTFPRNQLNQLLDYAEKGIRSHLQNQRKLLGEHLESGVS